MGQLSLATCTIGAKDMYRALCWNSKSKPCCAGSVFSGCVAFHNLTMLRCFYVQLGHETLYSATLVFQSAQGSVSLSGPASLFSGRVVMIRDFSYVHWPRLWHAACLRRGVWHKSTTDTPARFVAGPCPASDDFVNQPAIARQRPFIPTLTRKVSPLLTSLEPLKLQLFGDLLLLLSGTVCCAGYREQTCAGPCPHLKLVGLFC